LPTPRAFLISYLSLMFFQTVLPTSTATELLKRMDVGGWVGKYQTQYIAYGREFNLGYCYMEYGLYNVANEGVGNLVSRVFGSRKTNRRVRRAPGSTPVSPKRAVVRAISPNPPASSVAAPGLQSPKVAPAPVSVVTPSKKKTNVTATRRQGGGNQSQGPNLMNMANMLMQVASSAGGGGGNGDGGDKVNALLQNALPLLGQVATSPMIQGVVSNIVANFLTPPDNNRPPPQKVSTSGEESNEIDPLPRPPSTASMAPNGRPPPQQQQQQESGLAGMLGQIAQTYIKHYFSSKSPPAPPPPSATSPPKTTKNPDKISSSSATTQASAPTEEKSDIVETISEVAKPFFISYFGVVPGYFSFYFY